MLTTSLEISRYWESNPCSGGNTFFPYHLCEGKSVLEIGCGGGIDAERFCDYGAFYTGIDLTEKAVHLTKHRIGNKGRVCVMNAEFIDFPDDHFDFVYSFGVIHHSENPQKVFSEIYRVLKPRGIAYVMLYNKPSIRYNIDIMLLRNIAKWFHPRLRPYRHLSKKDWVSVNTDTLGCPKADVYTKQEALSFFYKFSKVNTLTTNWGWFRMIWGTK